MTDFFYWISILALSILSAVAGTITPAFFKQASTPRAHHIVKLWSECVARHQFAYVPYFITLGFVGNFGKHEVMKNLIPVLIVWVFISYLISVYVTSNLQELSVQRHHGCKSPKCEENIGFSAFLRLFRGNVILAVILLGVGLAYAGVVRRQSIIP